MRFAGTSTLSPVLGFRPWRDLRCRMRKLPKPRSSIFSSLRSASTIESKTVLTITSECFLVRSDTRATSSTSSALVIDAPPLQRCRRPRRHRAPERLFVLAFLEDVPAAASPLLFARAPAARVAHHFPEIDSAAPLRAHVRAEVVAVLVLGGALDRQADLLLGDVHLDDLRGHRVVDRQLVGRLLDALLGDLGDVHQPLDPLL